MRCEQMLATVHNGALRQRPDSQQAILPTMQTNCSRHNRQGKTKGRQLTDDLPRHHQRQTRLCTTRQHRLRRQLLHQEHEAKAGYLQPIGTNYAGDNIKIDSRKACHLMVNMHGCTQDNVPYKTAIQGTGKAPSTGTCKFYDDTAVYTSKTGKQGRRLGSGEPTQLPLRELRSRNRNRVYTPIRHN